MPKIVGYWSNDEIVTNTNNSLTDKTNKYKLKTLIDILVENFRSLYIPKEYICVDETLVIAI